VDLACPAPGRTLAVVTSNVFDALTADLLEGIRLVVREEVGAAGVAAQSEREGWLNTDSAAAYLDTSEDALRSAVKTGKIVPARRGTDRNARWSFTREQLDAYARGEAA
jgi:Helix-turn-helix domain